MSLLRNFLPVLTKKAPAVTLRTFSGLSGGPTNRLGDISGIANPFLVPRAVAVQQWCGFKVRGLLKKRCKDCYFVRRQERLYVICESHPRHKQMAMVKDPKSSWILSHATQGKIRPW